MDGLWYPYNPTGAQVLSRWRTEVDQMAGFVRRVMDERPGKSLTTHPERGMMFGFTYRDDRLAASVRTRLVPTLSTFAGSPTTRTVPHTIWRSATRGFWTPAQTRTWGCGWTGATRSSTLMIPDDCKDDNATGSYMAHHGQECISKLIAKRDKNGNIIRADLMFVGRQA